MASDLSRTTFDSKKHYRGVLMQQGRVQLDADWNEQLDTQLYRTHLESIDVIGETGVPKKGDAFKITPIPDGTDLIIAPGHIYVNGLLCELENRSPAVSYFSQPHYPTPDAAHFIGAFRSPPASPPASPPLSPPASPPQSPPALDGLRDGRYLVYIDTWQREVNYLDDPLIREVALHEADTATRLQNVWQVKLLEVTESTGNCETDFAAWQKLIKAPSGTLNVQTTDLDDPKNPCVLPPTAGYQRLENQLYRVEVHRGGTLAETTFKWSRENASVETIIEKVDGNILQVADIGRDEVLGFANGQWVEIVTEESSLNGLPRPLLQIESVDAAKREIVLDATFIPNTGTGDLKLRRWDQQVTAAGADGLAADIEWVNIEGGIQVSFSEGTYRPGDYWLIPARTATGEVEWPPYEVPNLNPEAQSPKGIRHHYCRLALLEVLRGVITVEDCRPLFPSLTEICAEDICYQGDACESNATTVQEALDELCQRGGKGCTYQVNPGPGWEAVFDRIPALGDAEICFSIGDYPLSNPVRIQRKGNLKLTGGGPGTQILAAKLEAALIFESCTSVTIRDLSALTGKVGIKASDATEHLNGTLTFLDCAKVHLDCLALKCGANAVRAATCISVRNGSPGKGIVRIQNCDLLIGYRQQGILLVNVEQAWVENNTLGTYKRPTALRLGRLVENKRFRAEFRSNLLSNVSLGTRTSTAANANTTLSAGSAILNFKTPANLKPGWSQLLSDNPPTKELNNKELYTHVTQLANRVLVDATFRNRYARFKAFFDTSAQQEPDVAAQGITVGGRGANDIRILNNSISAVLQGIHIGLSNKNDDNEPYLSSRVQVAGNTIDVILPATVSRLERYGIFVGNCKSLSIENNNISLTRVRGAENIEIEGIRVWGVLGDRVMITKNYLADKLGQSRNSFNIGIRVRPLNTRSGAAQWVVSWNIAASKRSTLSIENGVISEHNTP